MPPEDFPNYFMITLITGSAILLEPPDIIGSSGDADKVMDSNDNCKHYHYCIAVWKIERLDSFNSPDPYFLVN